MSADPTQALTVVVGSGGVGKTTVAAALGVVAAARGEQALVMTFDPSLRLKSALGIDGHSDQAVVPVSLPDDLAAAGGSLHASLLDARTTFDRLVARYAPDASARDRILNNPFYDRLSGSLAGILEYMAAERLFEVATEGRFDSVVLDTPPTQQALDFLEAPDRIVSFLDSGVARLASREWFDREGRLRPAKVLGPLAGRVESYLDQVVGLDLLAEMAEFFAAFVPLFKGFRARAQSVKRLLRAPETEFLLVCGPAEERLPDALFFARKLRESGFRLRGLVVNRVHPHGPPLAEPRESGALAPGRELMSFLGERDQAGLKRLHTLITEDGKLVSIPLAEEEPNRLELLASLGLSLQAGLRG